MRDITKDAKKFIQLQVMFAGMNAILTLFINTFLLGFYGSFSKEVLIYNMIMALVQPVAMITALKLTERKNALLTQRVGFVFFGLALVVLCVFGEKVSSLYPLFAIMLSFGAGYYYSVYSGQMLCYTEDNNRDKIAGIIGLWGSVISILLPLVSGLLLSVFGVEIGYKIVFGIAAVLAFLALLTNRQLPPLPKKDKRADVLKVAKAILSNKNGRLIMIASGFSDCRTYTIPIFVTLLFYNLMPDEFLVSVNSTVGYAVALIGSGIYGSVVKKGTRIKASLVAALISVIPILCMMFGLNVYVIILFYAVNKFFTTFDGTPVLNTHFKVMEELGLGAEYGAQVHLVREFFVSMGRILGLALVWIVPQTNTGAVVVLACMLAIQLTNSVILHKIKLRVNNV